MTRKDEGGNEGRELSGGLAWEPCDEQSSSYWEMTETKLKNVRIWIELLNEFHYRIVEEFLCLRRIEHRVFVEFSSNVLVDFETKSNEKRQDNLDEIRVFLLLFFV